MIGTDLGTRVEAGLDAETLGQMLEALRDFVGAALSDERMLELDHEDVCPEDLVRAMCSDELGRAAGLRPRGVRRHGRGRFDVYRVCEAMARIDLGLATSVLATFLGSDPILVGGTPEQQQKWLGRIAEEGILFAYGATEPEAGSDLAALRTTATPVVEDGAVVGYRITGRKQWISNGGIADAYTILALAPGGPTWFVLERGAAGFTHAKPEDKHGIRLSNTAALFLDDVYVPAENLVGGVEGRGLVAGAAGLRLHPADGRRVRPRRRLGGARPGHRVLDERVQAGAPLAEKQGYTHKLIVPHAVRLEAARALHRGDRHPDRRRRGRGRRAQHRGRDRQVLRHRGRQRRRRGGDPGARRLRLHPRVHRREDQAGRPDHHDLRGHLGDHGDDDRPRPLAAAPEDPRRVLPRARPASCDALHAGAPRSAPARRPWPRARWPACWRPAGSAG